MRNVVFITGATSGIGYATATYFLKKEWIVYATGRNQDSLNKLEKAGAITIQMDVTKPDQINNALEKVKLNNHKINVLINNAGYGQFGTFEETSDDLARKQFDTNVFGLADITRKVLPEMRNSKSGRIIIVSSIAGRISIPAGGWYAASKHALEALADAMRWEVKPFGIKVSVIQPGPIRTNFSQEVGKNKVAENENSAYGNMVKKLTETGAKSPGGTPEYCAKVIYKAATAKNPRNRYKITKEAWLIKILLIIFPSKLLDYFIIKAIQK